MKLIPIFFFVVAILAFTIAAGIDFPPPADLPPREHRAWGNFFCPLGFAALSFALFLSHTSL